MSNLCVIGARVVRRRFSLLVLAITIPVVFSPASLLADCPPPPFALVEAVVSAEGEAAVVDMDGCGRFVVGWQQDRVQENNFVDVLVRQYGTYGTPQTAAQLVSADHPSPSYMVTHQRPTISVALDGRVRIGWLGECDDCHPTVWPSVLLQEFLFGTAPVVVGLPAGSIDPTVQYEPSVGISDSSGGAVAWAGLDTTPEGLLFGPNETSPVQIRACGARCYTDKWLPAVSVCESMGYKDGYQALCWADSEDDALVVPPFNIALQVYDPVGVLRAERAGPDINDPELWVNDPSVEDPGPDGNTEQGSPAVAFNDQLIVVVWIGPRLDGCGGTYHIYARRFMFEDEPGEDPVLRDPDPMIGEGRAGVFIVDNDHDENVIIDPDVARPTVALSPSAETPERFIVVWNAVVADPNPYNLQVRAQYFDNGGRARGHEFTVNQEAQPGYNAVLSKSGAHTVGYGPEDQVVVAWTRDDGLGDPSVHFTLLPADHAETLDPLCCKGDVNDDGLRDGLDIQPFVDLLTDPPTADPCDSVVDNYVLICAADMNSDGVLDTDDIPMFVSTLLAGDTCAEGGPRGGEDCNDNGIADANDMADCDDSPWCGDCDQNFVLDECDIALCLSTDTWCRDLNDNGIPDGCEPDCNKNDIPDDKDIADETSDDINSNGIPDECEPDCNNNDLPDSWDISQQTSDDCNENGVPDECEEDCNANGVPDDCDIDPSDPDGNEEVSEDCNANGVPDECDLSRPLFPSLDCNDNLIPDECDIATCLSSDTWCQDCNENGIPDGCDIDAETSEDENENGIPDECEGGRDGGGGGGGDEDADTDEAWAEFLEWSLDQKWGPAAETSGSAQFKAMMDKLRELGLPAENPWYLPVPAR